MVTSIRKGPGRVSMADQVAAMDEFTSPESSSIHGAIYYGATGVLRVRFKNSKGEVTSTYDHIHVPEKVWKEFRGAESKGKFYIAALKGNKKYPAQKVA